MGCIRLEKMTEYLIDPLRRRALHLIEHRQKMLEPRPRLVCQELQRHGRLGSQTATICIAKLYDINPELVEDQAPDPASP